MHNMKLFELLKFGFGCKLVRYSKLEIVNTIVHLSFANQKIDAKY